MCGVCWRALFAVSLYNSFVIYLQTADSLHTNTVAFIQVEDIPINRVGYYKDTSIVNR